MGSLLPGKNQVGFVYANELIPERFRILVGSFILFNDSATMLWIPMYYKWISKNWFWFHIVSFGLNVVATLCLFFIEESPKFLIEKGKFAEARNSLIHIAKFNGLKALTPI